MNSPFTAEQAKSLAQRSLAAGDDPSERINRLFWLALSRPAESDEIERAAAFVNLAQEAANKSQGPWEQLAQLVLMSNEFMFVD
jgi:hypothetical protein